MESQLKLIVALTKLRGPNALQDALERIRSEAEDAVRSGSGHLVLTDHLSKADRVAMPMILATSAVHSHLTRKGLRTFTSINVRSAECIDPHYFAVLIAAGATVVNAYFAEDSIADRIDRGLLDGTKRSDATLSYCHRSRAFENHVQNGDIGYLLLSGRFEF